MSPIVPDSVDDKEKRENPESERALFMLMVMMLLGIIGIIGYALQAPNSSKFVSSAAIGLMVAGSSLLIGGLFGFLFGIPRTLQQDTPFEPVRNNGSDSSEDEEKLANYRANTNLEQISDWLTKILVGVGLTQITVIPEKLYAVATAVAGALDNTDGNRVFAVAVILFFVICGFLFGYLWTRLFLPGAFRQADLSALVNKVDRANRDVKQVNMKVRELEKQAEIDANALNLIQRQLNPSVNIPPVTQEQLNDAIRFASSPVKVQIFTQANLMRGENWRIDKPKMELTIPIFRALIESDKIDKKFHRNHGQLGFALKDQTTPNWEESEAALTEAINRRGSWEENGWLFYEFNRAYCRIMRDEEFQKERASKPEAKDNIFADLSAAAQSELKEIIRNNPNIKKWMSLNNVKVRDLD